MVSIEVYHDAYVFRRQEWTSCDTISARSMKQKSAKRTKKLTPQIDMRRLVLVIMVAIVVVVAIAYLGIRQTNQSHAATTIKVMPLGDSITQVGGTAMGFKGYLLDKLVAAGYTIDYVGSQRASGPAELKDWDHEGHSGWQNSNFQPVVQGYVSTYTPNVIIFHVGTNDIWSNIDPNLAITRMRDVLSKIYAGKPDTHVIVAKIIRMNIGKDAEWQSYNNQIPGVVNDFKAQGRKITMADLSNTLSTSDLQSDGIHVTTAGHMKMADAFFPVVKSVLDGTTTTPTPPPPPPSPPPAGATIVNNSVIGTGTNQWQYTGTDWKLYTDGGNKYLGDDHGSAVAGDFATLKFYGTKAEYYGARSPQAGIVGISVDGGAETMVDLYASVRADNALLYTTPNLNAGEHTFKIRLTGTKNPAATAAAAAVDRGIVYNGGSNTTPIADGCSTTMPPATNQSGTQSVSVATAGSYRLWARVKASAASNSFHLVIDNSCVLTVGDSTSIPAGSWAWVNYRDGLTTTPIDLTLAAGSHTLTYVNREGQIDIDRVLLVSDKGCTPTETGANCSDAAPAPLVGDVNGDNRVNAIDLSVVITHDGQNYPPADFNGDNTVGAADLAMLLAKWTW